MSARRADDGQIIGQYTKTSRHLRESRIERNKIIFFSDVIRINVDSFRMEACYITAALVPSVFCAAHVATSFPSF